MHEEVVYGPLYTYCSQCFTRWPCDFEDMRADLDAARADNARLREALGFYARPASWRAAGVGNEPRYEALEDQGTVAANVLAATAPAGTEGE